MNHQWESASQEWRCKLCGVVSPIQFAGHCKTGVQTRPRMTAERLPPPPLVARAANFGEALYRWAGSGFARRRPAEINHLLTICQTCPSYDAKREQCRQCGCPTRAAATWRNKLAWKSERCPLGKW